VADNGARAAAGRVATYRRTHAVCRGRSRRARSYRSVPARAATIGWTDGRNVRIDIHWSVGNANDARRYAAESMVPAPDVILATGSPATGALLEATRNVPIVFVNVVDPVGAGFVDNLSRPICGSHPQGREAGRHARAGANQVRTGDQPQNREGAWPDGAAFAARPR
jgi:ABC transporter substrate binding protein